MGFYRGPNIITDGLVLCLDAANLRSYTSGSTIWYDLAKSNNFTISNSGMNWNSSGVFDLSDGNGMYCDKIITLNTGCTFQFWMRTNDQRALFWTCQDLTYYLGAYKIDGKEYYNNFGSPNFYLDTIDVPNIYDHLPDNKWHMAEFKNVNMSTATKNYFNNYGGYNFDNGQLAMIFIYDRNLSQKESEQNYNALKFRYNL